MSCETEFTAQTSIEVDSFWIARNLLLHRVRPSVCLVVAGALPPLAGDAPGINNFDQVDARVYRGGQPTKGGFRYLASTGVNTVIDLRQAGDRAKAEERMVFGSGNDLLNVPMTRLIPPTETQLLKILPVLLNAAGGPVFVHCLRGTDRTGAVIAAYHITHDHWDNARALEDAKAHHMRFIQIPRQQFIKHLRPLTIEAKNAADGDPSIATAPPESPAAAGQPARADKADRPVAFHLRPLQRPAVSESSVDRLPKATSVLRPEASTHALAS